MGTRNQSIGLDIGGAFARAAWVTRDREGLRVERVESVALPAAGRVEDVIRPWLAKIGLAGRSCVLGLPGAQCMFQPILQPEDDPRAPADAAAVEVLKYNEMVSEAMVYGFAPFTAGEERRILLTMARPDAVDLRLAMARALEIGVADLVPMPVAWFRGLRLRAAAAGAPEGEVRLYLAAGASGTELAIGRGDDLWFARAFSAGGRLFTDRLARKEGMPVARAERAKVEQGSLATDAPHAASLRAAADAWLGEVSACLSVYRGLYPGASARVARVLLAGGAAALPGLAAYASERLDLPVDVVPDTGGVAPDATAGAVGLAASGAAGAVSDAAGLSLLPARLRDEIVFRRQKPYWIGAGAAAAAILAVSLLGGYRDIRRRSRALSEQRESLVRRQAINAEIEQWRAQADLLAAMARPVDRRLASGPALRDVLNLVAEAKHPDDWITLISDEESYFETDSARRGSPTAPRRRPRGGEEPEDETPAPEPAMKRLIVEGYTRQHGLGTVRDLITRLVASERVQSADLLGDDALPEDRASRPTPSPPARRFVIDVRVDLS